MKRIIWLLLFLGGTAVFAADDPAAAIIQRYLKLPWPAEDRQGEARQNRLRTLDELQSTPAAAVLEISRVLPTVKDARQRAELVDELGHIQTRESAAKMGELLDDPDAQVRLAAIFSLRMMARRVDRSGGQRTQRGGEFAPKVDGLVPYLVKAANDPVEQNRVTALFALADTLDPAAIAEIRHRLTDESQEVRFQAACFLTEFQDASGLGELKKKLEQLRSSRGPSATADGNYSRMTAAERLLASFERLTGKSFGPVPMDPMLSSDSHVAEASARRYEELLDAWAAWWAWEPGATTNKP